MENKEIETIKNHYVPQMYLKRFTCANGKCFVLDAYYKIKSRFPSEICYEENLYNFLDHPDENLPKNLAESMYNKAFENEANPILDNLVDCKKIKEIEDILAYDENAIKLKLFCISMVIRNKWVIKNISDTKRDVGQYDERFCEHDMNIAGMFEALNVFISKPFDIRILTINDNIPNQFITSDCPFIGLYNDRVLDSVFAIPLSPKILSIIIPRRDTIPFEFSVDKIDNIAFVEFINKRIYENVHTWLISNNPSLLEKYRFL